MPVFPAELRADLMTRWLTRAGWKTMLVAAPKPELEQVVLRIAVPLLATFWLLGDGLVHGQLEPGKAHGLAFAVAFLLFALGMLVLLLATRQQGRIVVVRRIIGMIADNAADSYFMFVVGEGGAIVFGVYLFVTFGNGFRYGRKYLHVSQALSLVGFGVVLLVSPFWSQHPWIGAGMMLAMLVLPFYVGVLAQRITEAKLRADEANAAKGRFLANVSHEMRTPLNGVIAMSDLLRETSMSESQREIVETLSTSAQLALAQIEDVLDMGKIEAGRIEIRTQPFMLGKLLTDVVKVVLPQARYKGLTVTTEIGPATPRGFVRERGQEEVLAQAGLREEEDVFASVWKSFQNRWTWLAVNLLTAFFASRVIGVFEGSIAKLVALAALMPIVAGIGGNSGNQTTMMILCAVALGQLTREHANNLLRKELQVALLNGVIWGGVMGVVAMMLYKDVMLGVVMIMAMTLNLLLAALMGVLIPMTMLRTGRDPAVGSSVLITAVTDSGGFFIFLGLATLLLL